MRLVIGLILALITPIVASGPAAAQPKLLWETKGLANPESVVQDPLTGALYVSNVNGAVMQKDGNGFISKLSPEGKITVREWVKGLNGPAGLALHDRTLYVGDIDELVAINVASGEIVKRYPAKGALFLNDVAAAPDGTIYVSDTPTNTIWRLKDGVFEPWLMSDELNGPNGLLVQGDKLIVASFGKLASEGQKEEKAAMLSVNIEDKKITKFGDGSPIGNLDGLESLVPGVYLVSDWNAGALYRIDAKGKATVLIDLNQGSADQTYLPDKKTVIIPMMLDSTLIAYQLDD
jgi:DNA-binding beta-propeller fold protein YncE